MYLHMIKGQNFKSVPYKQKQIRMQYLESGFYSTLNQIYLRLSHRKLFEVEAESKIITVKVEASDTRDL